jgi:hypothetical protein
MGGFTLNIGEISGKSDEKGEMSDFAGLELLTPAHATWIQE